MRISHCLTLRNRFSASSLRRPMSVRKLDFVTHKSVRGKYFRSENVIRDIKIRERWLGTVHYFPLLHQSPFLRCWAGIMDSKQFLGSLLRKNINYMSERGALRPPSSLPELFKYRLKRERSKEKCQKKM